MNQRKKPSLWTVTALAVVICLIVPWAVLADNTIPDGDGATPVGLNNLALGTVCAGSTTLDTALVAIQRHDNYHTSTVFASGATITVTVLSVTGTGLSATVVSPGTIVLPDDWEDVPSHSMSAAVTSDVTYVAGSAGSFSGQIDYRATGQSSQAGHGNINRDQHIHVTATVVTCNEPPSITVNDVTVEGDTTGGWTLDFDQIGTATDLEDGTPAVACTPAIASVLPLGANLVTCTATDSGGLTDTDSGTVTVEDTTAPALVDTPSSFDVEGNTDDGAYVDYTAPTATDIVDASPTVECLPASGAFYPLGPTSVTCTATDASGNSADEMFVITVVDTTAPIVIDMPADMTVEGNTTGGADTSFTPPTATDIVDPDPTVECDYDPAGAFYPLGDTMVTCTATDYSGNWASGGFIMTVEDTTAPALVDMPGDVTIEGNTAGGADYSFVAPTATDIVDDDPEVACDYDPTGAFYPLGVTTVTCTATDASGNESNDSFDVTVEDTTAPDLVNMPVDVTVEGNTAGGADYSFAAPTATDIVDGDPSVACDYDPAGAFYPLGVTTVTCTATDASGNEGSDSFDVTVEDTTAPALVDMPASFDVEGNTGDGAYVDYTAPTATDIVDAGPTVECLPASGAFYPLGPTGVTCTATDASGNSADEMFVITVVDTTAPIVIDMPADMTVEGNTTGGANTSFTPPTATDIVDPDPTVECDYDPAGAFYPLGDTMVTCTATDYSGNWVSGGFIVTVEDTTAPALVDMPGDVTIEGNTAGGADYSFVAPTATDIVDDDPEVACDYDPTGAFYPLGVTTVTCTATDASGNESNDSFDVTVEDTTAPDLVNMPVDVTVEGNTAGGADYSFAAPTATDIVDGDPSVACDYDPAGAFYPLGVTTVTCTATDASGNEGSDSFDVTVEDTTAPDLVDMPASFDAEGNTVGGAYVDYTAPTATDIVDAGPTVECLPASGAFYPLGPTGVTCTATDASGNSADEMFVITVVDTTAPVLSGMPDDMTVEGNATGGANTSFTPPTATDIVDGDPIVDCDSSPAGAFYPLGVTTVTCTATDASGNDSSDTFDVTVVDTTAPALADMPGDVTIEGNTTGGADYSFPAPTATDIVDGDPEVACDYDPTGAFYPLGVTTVTCTATDASGNESNDSFDVTVVDTTPPDITCPPDWTGIVDDPISLGWPSVSDIVDADPEVTNDAPGVFPLGETPVEWTATDQSLNASSCTQLVTLLPHLTHINKMKMTWEPVRRGQYKIIAWARVHDENHYPTRGITVSGYYTYPDGSIWPMTFETTQIGQAKFPIKTLMPGLYSFCVTAMTGTNYEYNPAANESDECISTVVGP